MFNFNTNKRQGEPTMNTAVNGGNPALQNQTKPSGSLPQENAAPQNGMPQQNAYINFRIQEIEAQRREFMAKKPDFDMKSEMQNPEFASYLLKNNLSVEDAYFLVHRDEIIENAVRESLNRIALRRNRIAENGAGKNSPAVVKKNPKDMSDKEIDAIIERVNNGEKISF